MKQVQHGKRVKALLTVNSYGDMGMKRFSAIILACTVAAVAGCSMEDAPKRGQKCPPVDVPGELDCIMRVNMKDCITPQNGEFAEAFSTQFCPTEYPHCVKDYRENREDHYYCMVQCGEGLVSCYGTCINPKENNDYCGADDLCSKWEKCTGSLTCQNGKCLGNESCDDDQMQCVDKDDIGHMERCQNKTWNQDVDCEGNSCQEDNTCGVCKNGDIKCEDGIKKVCEKGKWKDEPCKDSDGNALSCDAEGKNCGACNNGDVKCENDKTYTCADGTWGEETSCKGAGDAATSCKSDKTSCGECKNGEVKCVEGKTYQCENGVWPEEGTMCEDDASCKEDGKTCGKCKNGDYKCSSSKKYTCSGGMWPDESEAVPCPNGASCSDEKECGGCTNGEIKCEGGVRKYCNEGSWNTLEECENGVSCREDGKTCGKCLNDAKKCEDGKSSVCQNGTWGSELSCGGNNYSCMNSQVCCTPGTKKCDGKTKKLYTCQDNGTWDNGSACEAGVCKSDVACGECSPGTKSCSGGILKTCASNGTWSTTSCTAGMCKNDTTCADCKPNTTACDGSTKIKTCSSEGIWGTSTACPYSIYKTSDSTTINQTCSNGKCGFANGAQIGSYTCGEKLYKNGKCDNETVWSKSMCHGGHAYCFSRIYTGGFCGCTGDANYCATSKENSCIMDDVITEKPGVRCSYSCSQPK